MSNKYLMRDQQTQPPQAGSTDEREVLSRIESAKEEIVRLESVIHDLRKQIRRDEDECRMIRTTKSPLR